MDERRNDRQLREGNERRNKGEEMLGRNNMMCPNLGCNSLNLSGASCLLLTKIRNT